MFIFDLATAAAALAAAGIVLAALEIFDVVKCCYWVAMTATWTIALLPGGSD